ncbi:MAG: TonB-dependent receptor [Myxococcota bacterium]
MSIALLAALWLAAEPAGPIDVDTVRDDVEVISILGSPMERQRLTGSAYLTDEDFLEAMEYDDAGRALKLVPGVYVRDEDGFGLRPNIGLRGANSDRSKKIVLMEDGVLFAPAPYSAPAAYFFPLLTRMTGLEVFKGPASIAFGPNTIGGAVNLVSRSVPGSTQAVIDVAGGQRVYGKAHGAVGSSTRLGSGTVGALLEAVHLRSDGFKELDGGGDTGFEKNEAVLKLRYETDPGASVYQWLELKATYSDERSNETYLGLTEEDFTANPQRRYLASRDGLMEFQRGAAQLAHVVEFGNGVELRSTLYRSDFERTWGRLSTLGGQPLLGVLYSGDESAIALLSGERVSSQPADTLGFVTNERVYYAMGAQSALSLNASVAGTDHEIELGLRAHQDQVRRFHTDEGRRVTAEGLASDGNEAIVTTHNVDRSTAYSLYLNDEIQWQDLTLTPGVRAESIGWRRRNRLTRATVVDRYAVVLPGIGAYYGVTPAFGVLGGVHRGFSPVAPGAEDADPEFSVNYEAGARFQERRLQAEVVGFLNDYSNLTNVCSFSGGCAEDQIDRQFSAGAVNVYGAEAYLRYEMPVAGDLNLKGGISYTFTDSEFQDAFDSADPQFGSVDVGESLPYIPTHQGSVDLALSASGWAMNAVVSYVGEMRETADRQDPVFGSLLTDEQLIVDLGGSVVLFDGAEVYLRVDNLFNQQNIVSRRPFGARPGRPFSLFAGLRYAWGAPG